MNRFSPHHTERHQNPDTAAANWLVAHDRELTATERAEFAAWLAASPHHRAAWAEARSAWQRLDRLPEISEIGAATEEQRPPRTSRRLLWLAGLSAAAAVAAAAFISWPKAALTPPAVSGLVVVAPQQLTLSDGTRVALNSGSELLEQFSAGERRVRLLHGEAHFSVTPNAGRPFLVEAAGVVVRAVGTAFNVKLEPTAVDVLVTEGRVSVDPIAASAGSIAAPSALLSAGERAIASLAAPGTVAPAAAGAVEVSPVTPDEISQALAWQAVRLRFQDLALREVAAAFNRHNRTQLHVMDSAADVLVAGTFRADNVEVFVTFLEVGFDLSAERRPDRTIVLRKTR